MLIIALGWLFVAAMIAIGQDSVVLGVFSFIGWGPIPVGILWYLFGRKHQTRQSDIPAPTSSSLQPDQAGHATGDAITPVGEKPR